jgi:GNAT superfamily N-acetyltransferase
VGGISSGSRPTVVSGVSPHVHKYDRAFDWDDEEANAAYVEEEGWTEDEAVFDHAQLGGVLRGSRREALRAFSRMADGNDLTDILYRWNRYMANGEGMTRAQFNQIEITARDLENERRRISESAPRDMSQVQYTEVQRDQGGVWTIEARTASSAWVGRVRWELSSDARVMEITELQTDVDWGGKGIGRALMVMAEKQGVAAGVQRIRLEPNAQRPGRFGTLDDAQAALIRFYGSLGYTAERSGWMSKSVGGI